jgi:ankyrin repeat protein/WD40 repeat protein
MSKDLIRKTFYFFIALIQVFAALQCKAGEIPHLIRWHSSTPEQIFFSADGQYLVSSSSGELIISDLKTRKPFAYLGNVKLLEAGAVKNVFYTIRPGSNDTFYIETRNFPEGNIIRSVPIPAKYDGKRIVDAFLTGIDEMQGTYAIPYNNYGEAQCAVHIFNEYGVLVHSYSFNSNYKINAIWNRNLEVKVLTNRELFASGNDQLKTVFKSTSPTDNFSNFKIAGTTLVLLSNEYMRWLDLNEYKLIKKSDLRSFFVQNDKDMGKGLIMRFHHPFAVDSLGNAWIVNSMPPRNEYDKSNYQRYALCRMDGDNMDYPFISKEKGYREFMEVELDFAFNERQQVFAICSRFGGGNSILICHRKYGELFHIGERSLAVKDVLFTSEPGKILVRTEGGQNICEAISFKNGSLESFGGVDLSSISNRPESYRGFKKTGSTMKVFNPGFSIFTESPFYSKNNDQSFIAINLYDPVLDNTYLRDEGRLVELDKNNKISRSVEFTDTEGKKIKGNYVLLGYHYDTLKNFVFLSFAERYSSSKNLFILVDYNKFKVVKKWSYHSMLMLPGCASYLCEQGLKSIDDQVLFAFADEYRYGEDFILSSDGRHAFFITDEYDKGDRIFCFNLDDHHISYLGNHKLNALRADPFSGRIYSIGRDGTIKVWDPVQGEILEITVFGNSNSESVNGFSGGYLMRAPSGVYMGEGDYFRLISLRDSAQEIPFFQVDAEFHRPDKILSVMGYADLKLVKQVEKASDKRSVKAARTITPAEIFFTSKGNIPFYTDTLLHLEMQAVGDISQCKGIMIYVNGTPVKPAPGFTMNELNSRKFMTDVELVDELNHIRISLVGSDNLETPGDQVIVQSGAALKGDGLSEYKNVSYNLRYAEKDMTDILRFFNTTSNTFNTINVKSFTGDKAGLSVAGDVREFVSHAKAADQVLVYFAGHGMLEPQSGNYFLSTYVWDHHDPASTGINYETLLQAVGSSPARKKTMIIDACNSGLVDDLVSEADSSYVANNESGEEETVKRGSELLDHPRVTASSLMMTFRKLNQGNGVDVLAASAGNEFAQERGELKNGLFTYALLAAFKSGDADLDGNGMLTVKETYSYITPLVLRLSRGQQRPSYRQVNYYAESPLFKNSDSYFSNFLLAAQNDHVPTLRIYVEQEKLPIDKEDNNGFTALMFACREGNYRAAKYLIEQGASIGHESGMGFTPLYLAAFNGHDELVYFLLDKGAKNELLPWQVDGIHKKNNSKVDDILNRFDKMKDRQGKVLKMVGFIGSGNFKSADSLRSRDNLKTDEWLISENTNPLLIAIATDNIDAVKWILENGGNVNETRKSVAGITPLMFAAYKGNTEIVRYLISKGADKTTKDLSGHPVEWYVKDKSDKEMMSLLE